MSKRIKIRGHGLVNLHKWLLVVFGTLLLSQVKCMVAGGGWSGRRGPEQPWEVVLDTSFRNTRHCASFGRLARNGLFLEWTPFVTCYNH